MSTAVVDDIRYEPSCGTPIRELGSSRRGRPTLFPPTYSLQNSLPAFTAAPTRHGVSARENPLEGFVLRHITSAEPDILPGLHSSARRHALSKFTMPAMSPTMSEGGVSAWKKKEGESYATGDVLLEVVRCGLHSV